MRSSGKYQVNNPRENEIPADRDHSYRNCVFLMIVFLLLCLMLIFISWLLKPSIYSPDDSEALVTSGTKSSTAKFSQNNTTESQQNNSKIEEFEEINSTNIVNKKKDDYKIVTENYDYNENNSERSQDDNNKNYDRTTKIILPTIHATSKITSTENILPITNKFYELSSSPSSIDYQTNPYTLFSSFSYLLTSTTSSSSFSSPLEENKFTTEENNNSDKDETKLTTDLSETTSSSTEIGDDSLKNYFHSLKNDEDERTTSNLSSETSPGTDETTIKNSEETTTEINEVTINNSSETTTEINESGINNNSLNEILIGIFYGNLSTPTDENSSTEIATETETITTITDEMIKQTDNFYVNTNNDSSSLLPTTITRTPATDNLLTNSYDITTFTTDKTIYYDTKSDNKDSSTTEKTLNDEKTKENKIVDNEIIINKNNSNNQIDSLPAICETGRCKQFTSKMLSYMNHSADACEDFYEYACGGMEADFWRIDSDLSHQVIDRMKKMMKKSDKKYKKLSDKEGVMKYYESCINYDKYYKLMKKKSDNLLWSPIKQNLQNIGNFHTPESWSNGSHYPITITQVIAKMILNNSPLLFDILPSINEKDPKKFSLKIQPIINHHNYLNYDEEDEISVSDRCIDDIDDYNSFVNVINIEELGKKYESCKMSDSRIGNISNWINELNKSFEEIQGYVADEVYDINFQILEHFFRNFSAPEYEIRAAYKIQNYSIITLQELQRHTNIINWKQLIFELIGVTLPDNAELQIYFKNELITALKALESLLEDESQQFELNNALLGFYATNVYNQIMKFRTYKDLSRECLKIAMKLAPKKASAFYLSSFAKTQLDYVKAKMHKIFLELKNTLNSKFSQIEWTTSEGRNVLLTKLANIQLSTPDTFLFTDRNIISREDFLIPDFLENTIILSKSLRINMYSMLNSVPSDSENLWTYFAKPFQTTPQTIRNLDIILMPFGAIDWTMIHHYENEFDYLVYATIGNILAREIANNFDTNGLKYLNGIRYSTPFATVEDDLTRTVYQDFINCQEDILFDDPIEMTIPLTNQLIQFQMPVSTLNERLTDVMSIKLAHDTFIREHKTNITKLLPWLSLDTQQLFYLAYAQTYCSKSRPLNFYISLYEKLTLPGRIRLFAAAINIKDLGQTWNCPEGSKVFPNFSCGSFPEIDYQGAMMESL